jgi:hypothetical protein
MNKRWNAGSGSPDPGGSFEVGRRIGPAWDASREATPAYFGTACLVGSLVSASGSHTLRCHNSLTSRNHHLSR